VAQSGNAAQQTCPPAPQGPPPSCPGFPESGVIPPSWVIPPTHAPIWHAWPGTQAWHALPIKPHAPKLWLGSVTHALVESQQPPQFAGVQLGVLGEQDSKAIPRAEQIAKAARISKDVIPAASVKVLRPS